MSCTLSVGSASVNLVRGIAAQTNHNCYRLDSVVGFCIPCLGQSLIKQFCCCCCCVFILVFIFCVAFSRFLLLIPFGHFRCIRCLARVHLSHCNAAMRVREQIPRNLCAICLHKICAYALRTRNFAYYHHFNGFLCSLIAGFASLWSFRLSHTHIRRNSRTLFFLRLFSCETNTRLTTHKNIKIIHSW